MASREREAKAMPCVGSCNLLRPSFDPTMVAGSIRSYRIPSGIDDRRNPQQRIANKPTLDTPNPLHFQQNNQKVSTASNRVTLPSSSKPPSSFPRIQTHHDSPDHRPPAATVVHFPPSDALTRSSPRFVGFPPLGQSVGGYFASPFVLYSS